MSKAAQAEVFIEVTTATNSTPHGIVAAALEDLAVKEAIRRGTRKAQVKKYASVTIRGQNGVCEYTSDFEQSTYLKLLEHHAEEFTALSPEQRPGFVEKLAMSVSWKQVYPMKREVPLAEPFDGDHADSEASPRVFACDDISLNRQRRHADWTSAHALESELIERIDRQRAEMPPEEQPETKYERMCRVLGEHDADWMLDYENSLYESAKPAKDRVKYFRLRKKLNGM